MNAEVFIFTIEYVSHNAWSGLQYLAASHSAPPWDPCAELRLHPRVPLFGLHQGLGLGLHGFDGRPENVWIGNFVLRANGRKWLCLGE